MKKLLSLLLILFCVEAAHAQFPDLPGVNIVTVNAQNVLKWNSNYDGLAFIAIQRSKDSIRNFSTIGQLAKPKKGHLFYTDTKPMPGRNFYRLQISFGDDLEWYSNVCNATVDSALLAQQLILAAKQDSIYRANNPQPTSPKPNNTKPTTTQSTPKPVVNNTTETPAPVVNNEPPPPPPPPPPPKPVPFYYTPSTQVFSNPYTGHITIQLSDAADKKYKLFFYDQDKNEVLRVSRIQEPLLILDKNNFNRRGVYSFTLFNGTDTVEQGYVTIQ
ncbi:MAG: hypothetical protein ACR2IL_05890 [Chitinophagaceae bacterium]